MRILLDENKPFFKANLHCHTTNSDGALTPEQIKAAYQSRGYSIVAFTDHEHVIDNSHLTDENFLAINGCEVAIKEFEKQSTLVNLSMRVAHLNFYAKHANIKKTPCYSSVYDHYVSETLRPLISHDGEYQRTYNAQGINEIIRTANEQGFLVSYNHPTWSLENATDYLAYRGLFAVEIVNNSCIVAGNANDEHAFDDFLRADIPIFCTACDDNHNHKPLDSVYSDSFGGWVCINADKLDYESVICAMQKGDFYASTGPQITALYVENGSVHIRTSAAQNISLVPKSRKTRSVIAEATPLTGAAFALHAQDEYFRIKVTDEHGKSAYTQAYSVKDLV